MYCLFSYCVQNGCHDEILFAISDVKERLVAEYPPSVIFHCAVQSDFDRGGDLWRLGVPVTAEAGAAIVAVRYC